KQRLTNAGASAQKATQVYSQPVIGKNRQVKKIPQARLLPAFRLKPFGSGICFFPGLKPGV
ncbi:MAG: hypothetical protein M9901_09925, partial [Lentimicrobium sp.]|nr:hypothetical protein [Lentimicrobium sp.]